jgi:twitching motility protein PilT
LPRQPINRLSYPEDIVAKIDELLLLMLDHNASDLHISVGNPPILRINGQLHRSKFHDLTSRETEFLLMELLTDEDTTFLKARRDIDLAYEIPKEGRFRSNIYYEKEGLGASFRLIPATIKTLDELNMPAALKRLVRSRNGLVLVTGPTGSGKSTTLAAMIDLVNREKACHIITLEDPIEFIHPKGKALIHQRQIGIHVESFASGLRAGLREDPDIILVGEMRDLETIHLALTAAETGLLVLGTLHTSSAIKTVDRIVDAFPADQQPQVRTMLSESLQGVVAQQLLRRADGAGRIAAIEIMICTRAIRNLLREGKAFQITSALQTGTSLGMQTMESQLHQLVEKKLITHEEASTFMPTTEHQP